MSDYYQSMIPPRVLGVITGAWGVLAEGKNGTTTIDGWRVSVCEGVLTIRRANMCLFPEHDKGPKPEGYKSPLKKEEM